MQIVGSSGSWKHLRGVCWKPVLIFLKGSILQFQTAFDYFADAAADEGQIRWSIQDRTGGGDFTAVISFPKDGDFQTWTSRVSDAKDALDDPNSWFALPSKFIAGHCFWNKFLPNCRQ